MIELGSGDDMVVSVDMQQAPSKDTSEMYLQGVNGDCLQSWAVAMACLQS